MTRKEAIEILKYILTRLTEGQLFANWDKAIVFAIYSLEKDEAYQLEYERTTKNCESCRYYGSHHEVCNYCYKCSLWTEEEPTTKNDLGVDCVSRKAVLNTLERMDKALDTDRTVETYKELLEECFKVLPSVTPQEPILDKITEIIEPLRHLSIDEMSDIEWQILRVIDKYKAEIEPQESEDKG